MFWQRAKLLQNRETGHTAARVPAQGMSLQRPAPATVRRETKVLVWTSGKEDPDAAAAVTTSVRKVFWGKG